MTTGSRMALLAHLHLWLRRQKCKLYVGACPLCAPQKESNGEGP